MTIRYVDRATRSHSRQKGMFSDSLDRFADSRVRRAGRSGGAPALMLGCGFIEHAEIERRSRFDTFAPVRA